MDILIDAFGGDHSPEEVIAGSVEALKERDDFNAVFVGKQDVIEELLKGYEYDKSRVKIIHAPDIISCEEEPVLAVRRKTESSIVVALKELKENPEAGAFVSAGSSGGVLAGATLRLGRIKGVNRPAFSPIMPTIIDGKNVVLLDSGANADCKNINLVQFAVMGSCYAEALGMKNPRVALLSNGTEDEKGNALNHEVFPLLKQLQNVNFVGNIEARDILTGDYDVIVCDGFSGNIALKGIEGAVGMILKLLKQSIYSSFMGKIGGLFLKKTFKKLKARLDYNNHGGALLLGVNKAVIKAHGSSKRVAIKAAVLQAAQYATFNISEKISEKLELNASVGTV